LRRQAENLDVVCLVPAGYRTSDFAKLAHQQGHQVFEYSSACWAAALLELAGGASQQIVVVGEEQLALSPFKLVELLTHRHVSAGSWYTNVRGLPRGVDPLVISRSLLELLPLEEIGSLFDLRKMAPLVVGECQKSSDPNYRCARVQVLDAVSEFALDRKKLPEVIEWTTYRGCRLLDELIDSDQTATAPPETLMELWREKELASEALPRIGLFQKTCTSGREGRPRVLLAANQSAYAGAHEALVTAVGAIGRSYWDLHAFISLDGYFADKLAAAGVNVHVLGEDFSAATFRSFQSCDSIIKHLRPNVIHLNGDCGLPIILAAAANGIPLLYHARLSRCALPSETLRQFYVIIAVSYFVRETLLAEKTIQPSSVRVIYDGVDMARFSREAFDRTICRGRLGVADDAVLVLMPGRYTPAKRQDLLIAAVQRLAGSVSEDWHLVFVGDRHGEVAWESHLRTQAARLRRPENVHILGFEEDVRWAYTAADIVSCCGEGEALGQSVLESMAMGVPVLLADSGASSELIEDGEQGLMFRPGDAEDLAEKLRTLLLNSARRKMMGASGQMRCQRLFTAAGTALALQQLYEEAIASS
jgi:glycosyltransferase involved in cell wall biosynthesis